MYYVHNIFLFFFSFFWFPYLGLPVYHCFTFESCFKCKLLLQHCMDPSMSCILQVCFKIFINDIHQSTSISFFFLFSTHSPIYINYLLFDVLSLISAIYTIINPNTYMNEKIPKMFHVTRKLCSNTDKIWTSKFNLD